MEHLQLQLWEAWTAVQKVQCLLEVSNGTYELMLSKACSGNRPEVRRPCLRVPYPAQWQTGAWSLVS